MTAEPLGLLFTVCFFGALLWVVYLAGGLR